LKKSYFEGDAYNKYINAQIMLPRGNEMQGSKVTSRKRDHDGNPIERSNPNPILDSRIYDVLFANGLTEQYAANVIAEQMFSQVDSEWNSFAIMDEKVEHKNNSSLAVAADDHFIVSPEVLK
jgi:hypothetical protein